MPTLEHDELVFRFPELGKDAVFRINFQRTLRIPETDLAYDLPPGFGRFPVRHAEDYPDTLPAHTVERGGVILPIWQTEAMWLEFVADNFPVAVKVAAGKINAVTGEPWVAGLNRDPQDYMVCPEQYWLDGFAVEAGVIRQFVAMPLDQGFSAEEQLTGSSEWGGVQISVTPLKKTVWDALKLLPVGFREDVGSVVELCEPSIKPIEMGLGAGGLMTQRIEPDERDFADWDQRATQRVFVSLIHAKDWQATTGEAPHRKPISAEAYTKQGGAWLELDEVAPDPLSGGEALEGIVPVSALSVSKIGIPLSGSDDVEIDTDQKVVLSKKLNGA